MKFLTQFDCGKWIFMYLVPIIPAPKCVFVVEIKEKLNWRKKNWIFLLEILFFCFEDLTKKKLKTFGFNFLILEKWFMFEENWTFCSSKQFT